MRHLYVAVLAGLLPRLASAQTTAEADSVRDAAPQAVAAEVQWVQSQVDSATNECTEILLRTGRSALVRVFHPSGHLKDYLPYADFSAGQLHGVATSWYDDGQLATQQTYLRGKREGELLLYYANGQLKRQTQYEGGTERLGNCFDPVGAPLAYFPYEQPPLYPGGQLQLVKEVKDALRKWRPTWPIQLATGQLYVSLLIEADGHVANPRISLANERFLLSSLPSSQTKTTLDQIVGSLTGIVQQAVTQLAKPFYPGQRDGNTISWRYSFTVPFDYGAYPPAMGNMRRGANFAR